MVQIGGRLMSQPVRVRMAGWESDTYHLQGAGWELSADQDVSRGTMRLALHHKEMGITALSAVVDWRYEVHSHNFRAELPIVHVEHFGRSRTIMVHGMGGGLPMAAFQPIDAVPSFTTVEPQCLEDLVHFASFEQKRVILPAETVDDLMRRILDLQEPARQAYFLEEAKRERGRLRIEAQVMSFAA